MNTTCLACTHPPAPGELLCVDCHHALMCKDGDSVLLAIAKNAYNRRARILWNVAQITVERAKAAKLALAEERTLRGMVEAENVELRKQLRERAKVTA